MLDGVGSMSAAIKAFRCGFVDYLVKETTGDRALQDAILRATRMVRAERAKVQHIRHFEWLSQRDGITGLANRHHMQDRLEQLVQMGLRHNSQFAAILIRVNEYDYINASFGSIVGDQALHAFSSKLKAVVRKSDTVGRLDKDTFLYLVDRDVTDQSIAGVCGRLAEATRFSMELDTLSVSLSSSVAAAVYPADGATVAELLDAADRVSPYGASNSKTKLAPTKMSPEGTRNLGTSASLDGATAGLAASHNGVVTGERPASQPASNGYGGSNSVASLRTDAGMAHVAAMESANGVQPARMGREQPAASANALEVGARTPDSMVIRAENRRIAQRHRVLKRGSIVFNDGFCAINCVIRDLSTTGARVTVDGQFNAPRHFELLIADTGKKHKVEKRWQRGNEFGLQFLP